MLQVSVIDHSLDHGASLPFVPFYSELLIYFGVLSFKEFIPVLSVSGKFFNEIQFCWLVSHIIKLSIFPR